MLLAIFGGGSVRSEIMTDAAATGAHEVMRPTTSYTVTRRSEADQDGCVKELGVKRGMSWRHALNEFTADLDDAAATPLFVWQPRCQSGVALRFPPQSINAWLQSGRTLSLRSV